MIQHLSRSDINITKYDNCIANAANSRIYAYSWYLDIVCDTWSILVKDDYKFVMPLPNRKKYGINYIYQPPWVQQLGIFSNEFINTLLIEAFINAIPNKFKLIDLLFNSKNSCNLKGVKSRKNYLIDLNKSYNELRKNYKKGRQSSVNFARRSELKIVDHNNYNDIIKLFKKNKGAELNKKQSDYVILEHLMQFALNSYLVKIKAVFNSENNLVGGAFFLTDKHRITYLFSAINNEGREKQAMSFLIDSVIDNFAKSNLILDLEGSMIKNLGSYFRSFGAQLETYYHLKKYNIY
jgi:hypothetical protein